MTEDRLSIVRDFVRTTSAIAWHLLHHSELVDPMLTGEKKGTLFGRRKLLLWIDTVGFTDVQPCTLTVFQPFRGESPVLRKATWERTYDFRMLHEFSETQTVDTLPEPSPTLTIKDKTIDGSCFQDKLSEVYGLSIPVAWSWHGRPMSMTTDTGSVGFEFFDASDPQASIRYTWADHFPPEWQALSDWFQGMFEWLDDQLHET